MKKIALVFAGCMVAANAYPQDFSSTQLIVCLNREAANRQYVASDPVSLRNLLLRCPDSLYAYYKACERTGQTEKDCGLNAMLMAMKVADQYPR